MPRLRSPITNDYRSVLLDAPHGQRTFTTATTAPDSGSAFRIESCASGYQLVPLHSLFLNGTTIVDPTPISFGDRISYGRTLLVFEDDQPIIEQTRQADAFEHYSYESEIGLPNGMSFILGRQDSLQVIRLNHPSVSQRHVRIDRRQGRTQIRDLGSSNGTFVNGKRIYAATNIAAGDRIGIGPYLFVFTGDRLRSLDRCPASPSTTDPSLLPVDLCCQELTRTANGTGQVLLANVDLHIPAGKFVCILGPSGAGKSTLLRALANREQLGNSLEGSGTVSLNGANLAESFEQLKHRMAFVPQHEILFDDLTLVDSLNYAARLRLPSDLSKTELRERIENVLETVGLQDSAHKLISRLSGGQRKRAALATELLAQPGILFADEVTSGLDEMTDGEVMKLFRAIADRGQSVVCVTHSLTFVAQQCHLLVVLTRFGHLAFFGSPDQALEFFQVSSLSDIYPLLAVENVQAAQHMAKAFHQPVVAKRIPPSSRDDARRAFSQTMQFRDFSVCQFLILQGRDWRRLWVDLKSNLLKLLQCVVVAVLLCSVFSDVDGQPLAQINCCFILLVSCFWFGCNAAAKEIVRERAIFEQERRIGVKPLSYLASKLCILTALATLQACLLVSVVQWYCQLPGSWVAWSLVAAFMALAGSALGLAISAAARNEQSANAAVPILLIPQIILAGAVAELTGANLWLGRLAIAAYSGLQSGRWILEQNAMSWLDMSWLDMDFWSFILVLIAQSLVCLVVSLASLQRSHC